MEGQEKKKSDPCSPTQSEDGPVYNITFVASDKLFRRFRPDVPSNMGQIKEKQGRIRQLCIRVSSKGVFTLGS